MKLWGDEALYRNDCETIDLSSDGQSRESNISAQKSKAENVLVYPNPNNGSFSIAYTFEQGGNEFVLYDLVGKEVTHLILENNEGVKEFTNTGLTNGIYFYKVQNGKNIVFTGKLVINK